MGMGMQVARKASVMAVNSILAFLVLASAATAQSRYPSPDDLVLSPDGTRLYAVLSGTGEVVAIDTAKRAIAGRVAVGKVPRGIAITPDGARLYVTNSWADTVSEIDAATLQPMRTLPAGFEPTGIAFDGRGALYVANRLSDDVAVVDLASGAITRRLISAHGASYAAASADGSRIYVTHIYPFVGLFRTPPRSEIAEIDARTQIVTNRITLPDAAGVFHVTLSRDGRLGLAALLRPRNLVPLAHVEHGWAFGDSLAVFGEDIGGVVQMPLDFIEDYFSLPFGVAIAPDKKRAYVSASGSNEVAVLDLARLVAAARSPSAARMANDLSAASHYVIARIPVGRNPRNIALSADGATLWVANRLDDGISIIDTAAPGGYRQYRARRPAHANAATARGTPVLLFGGVLWPQFRLRELPPRFHLRWSQLGPGAGWLRHRHRRQPRARRHCRHVAFQMEWPEPGSRDRMRPADRAVFLPLAGHPRRRP